MTSQPVHDRLDRTPTWTIQGVFDPDVQGQDFSYTIGLHDLGFPELHMWGSPTDGHDPGDDWAFSHRDRGEILNEAAFKMVDGRLMSGSRWEQKFDAGLVTARFEVQPPGDREALQALGIAPGAEVLPLSWTLERPPVGDRTPLVGQRLQAAFDEYADLVRSLPGRRGPAPDGWALAAIPDFDVEDRYGPRTPVVLARAAQLWSTVSFEPWIEEALVFHARGGLMWPATIARSLARPVGRTDALRLLEADVPTLVVQILDRRAREWQRAVNAVASRSDFEADDRQELEHHAHHSVAELALSVLSLELVADVADRDLRLYARGPWVAACHPDRALPGPEWAAPPPVIRVVRKLLRPLTLHGWSELLVAHAEETDDAYADLYANLRLRYVSCASGVPWSRLADLPAGREFKHASRRFQELTPMVDWASCLATLLTFRAEYSTEQVATFVAPVRELLPTLERALHAVR